MELAFFPNRSRVAPDVMVRKPRRISEGVFVACPLIFSAFVALYSRNYQDRYQVPTSTPQQESAVLAYAPYVRDANLLFSKSNYYIDRKQMLQVAGNWQKADESGALQPLQKVSFEDSIQQGVRGQIMHSKSMLVSALFEDAKTLESSGQANQAAREVLLGVKLSQGLKYSDFNSVFLSDEEQRRAAAFLERNAKDLNSQTKQDAKDLFAKVLRDSSNLDAMTRESRVQYYDWASRITQSPISLDQARLTAMLTDRITSNPDGPRALHYTQSSIMDSEEDDSPVYLSELRMAWKAEASNKQAAKALVSQL